MTIHDFSLDIETLSTAKNAVILSIGAVYLNNMRFEGDFAQYPNSFYRVITVQDQVANGRIIDYKTLKWWLEQDDKIRELAFEGMNDSLTQTLGSAIIDLTVWAEEIAKGETKNVWVKGINFDGAIIESIYSGPGKMSDVIPFDHRSWQEVRTLERLVGESIDEFMHRYPSEKALASRMKHHALYDSRYQGIFVGDIMGHFDRDSLFRHV